MKGILFTTFNRLVEEQYGLETWQRLLDQVAPASEGIYTAGESYDEAEFFALLGELSQATGASVPDLTVAFGEYMLLDMAKVYPIFFKGIDLKTFLLSIDSVIHVEVRKLFPDAAFPRLSYEDPGEGRLVVLYRSKRKLCLLAEGLIDGTAKWFNTPIERKQTRCLHRGDDHCRIELAFASGPSG